MRAVIVAIGSELLQGFLTDTNSTFLAQELTALGVDVVGISEVGDHLPTIVRALERALEDAHIVVCTGGIGPTADDLTREAVAAVCSETPQVDLEALETVRSFFTRRGAEMPERNAKQAWLIPSAEFLPNPVGTAPGWFVRHKSANIIIMPGVPREMMPMWRNEAIPRLLPSLGGNTIVSTTLKTIGIGESAVEERLRNVIDRGNPTVSTYAKNDGVHVRILAIAQDGMKAEASVASAEREIKTLLGQSVYGDLNTSLPAAVLAPLRPSCSTLAIWEHNTGGQVTSLLLSDPEITDVVVEGRITGRVPPSLAQSPPFEQVKEAAADMQSSTGATHAIGVLVAFDSEDDLGRFDARVEIAITANDRIETASHRLSGRKAEVGRRASLLAAEALRAVLQDSTFHRPG